MVETLEKGKDAIMSTYLEIRDHIMVSTELRRCVDACDAVTTDIRKLAYERLAGIDGDFDAEQAQGPLKELLKQSYAHSTGSTVARMSCKSSASQHGKYVDAAADLAAKEAEEEAVLIEKKQREKILHAEEQQRRQLEAERYELERLDSMSLNRLPVPEPSVFNGNPIQFLEWKASFKSLIDARAISSADEFYYLRKYVGGPARKTLEGTFYRNDDEAYNDAWNKLDHRYGQAFVIQRAFRETRKLAKNPARGCHGPERLFRFLEHLSRCNVACEKS